jgi:DNA polymerase III sliding clamp (beta) subunit (PCNA family)
MTWWTLPARWWSVVHTATEGTFPRYESLLPAAAPITVTVERAWASAEAERAKSLLWAKRQKHGAARITVTEGTVSIAPYLDGHVVTPARDADCVGVPADGIVRHINAGYLVDALAGFGGDTLTMHWQHDPSKPLLLTDNPAGITDAAAFRHLLIPVRVDGAR